MAVAHGTFREYYAALKAQVPTFEDLLRRVQRDEHAGRRQIEDDFDKCIDDLFFLIGTMNGDRKRRANGLELQPHRPFGEAGKQSRGPIGRIHAAIAAGAPGRLSASGGGTASAESSQLIAVPRGAMVSMDKDTMALLERETAVWLPEVPPRTVKPPNPRMVAGFPRAAFAKLCEEEAELRNWLDRVQHRIWESIEQAYAESWFLVVCTLQCEEDELVRRLRVEEDENTAFIAIKRRLFREAPPSYFYEIIVRNERKKRREQRRLDRVAKGLPVRDVDSGECGDSTDEDCDDDDETGRSGGDTGTRRSGRRGKRAVQLPEQLAAVEAEARLTLLKEEYGEREILFKWLHDMYGVRLFSTNRVEVHTRNEIEEQWAAHLWSHVIIPCATQTFGKQYRLLGSVAWHGADHPLPLLRALAMTTLPDSSKTTCMVQPGQCLEEHPAGHSGKWEAHRMESTVPGGSTPQISSQALDSDVHAQLPQTHSAVYPALTEELTVPPEAVEAGEIASETPRSEGSRNTLSGEQVTPAPSPVGLQPTPGKDEQPASPAGGAYYILNALVAQAPEHTIPLLRELALDEATLQHELTPKPPAPGSERSSPQVDDAPVIEKDPTEHLARAPEDQEDSAYRVLRALSFNVDEGSLPLLRALTIDAVDRLAAQRTSLPSNGGHGAVDKPPSAIGGDTSVANTPSAPVLPPPEQPAHSPQSGDQADSPPATQSVGEAPRTSIPVLAGSSEPSPMSVLPDSVNQVSMEQRQDNHPATDTTGAYRVLQTVVSSAPAEAVPLLRAVAQDATARHASRELSPCLPPASGDGAPGDTAAVDEA